MKHYSLVTYLSLILTMFLWGGTFLAGRMLGNSLPPASTAFLRFAVASVTLLAILRISHGHIPKPKKNQWFPLFFLGLTGIFAYNICFFEGLRHISAGRAALIIAGTPLVIAIASTFLFKEKMSSTRLAGITLSFIGAIFVISNGHPTQILNGSFGIGEKALLGCVASWSAYTLMGRKVLNTIPPLTAVCFSCLIGTILLIIPALQSGLIGFIPNLGAMDWFNILYLGIGGTALGFWWYYRAIKEIGASRAAIFINLVPLFALLLSHFLLGESVKLSVLAGGLLVLTGVTITNHKASK